MKISYNWLKSYVPDIPEPHQLAKLLTYHLCEVESYEKLSDGDYLFDLGILPNRAHDLLSHQGVAKELCGLLGVVYKDPTVFYKIPESKSTDLNIKADGARRYMARIVRNVTVDFSPEWVKNHLESIGQRSINNIVDATNIVMYDCGQPCHAFDLDKIKGQVVVRDAVEGEKITLLDGKEVALQPTDVVIADDEGPLAIAGVKGGKRAEVGVHTKNILLEVANFYPVKVRKTARRLGIFTDSAKRFENDLSPELCSFAMTELCGLLVEYGCTDFEDIVDIYNAKEFTEKRTLSFTTATINKKLGATITDSEIEKILKNYGYEFIVSSQVSLSERSSDTRAQNSTDERSQTISESDTCFEITIPPLRLDLVMPEDMVEEIGRVYGYDKVVPQLPKLDFVPKKNEVYEKVQNARSYLVKEGYREVMTYAFAEKGDIEVLASASDKKFLRTNLSDGLKRSYEMNRLNIPILGAAEIKIFEIGTVFKNGSEIIHVGYADKKGVKEMALEEFISSALSNESLLGSSDLLAQDSKEERGQTTNKDSFDSAPTTYNLQPVIFSMWSLYPFIARDVAVWVPEGTDPQALKEIYKEFGAEILRGEPQLFDQFTKDGRTSYAFRLIFQAYDRTLTDEEVSTIMAHIYEKLASLSYEVR